MATETIKEIIINHYTLRPKMQIADLVKLVYQGEFGCGHMADEPYAASMLEKEYSSADTSDIGGDELEEYIGGGMTRINLRPAKAARINPETIARLFSASASRTCGSKRAFEQKLYELIALCEEGEIPFDPAKLSKYIKEYKKSGYPPVSHSALYREAYRPAYRVIRGEYAHLIETFNEIDTLLRNKECVTIAIDGNCGAGKSGIAEIIRAVYDCNVFHMDDFFLSADKRTPARLNEPGGNVDRERFASEVLAGIESGGPFRYKKFDCRSGRLGKPVCVIRRRLNIIEGSYSMHPDLSGGYCFGIFMKAGAEEQKRRLKERDAGMYERYVNEWIPLEEKYFRAFGIESRCRFVYYCGLQEKRLRCPQTHPVNDMSKRPTCNRIRPKTEGLKPLLRYPRPEE